LQFFASSDAGTSAAKAVEAADRMKAAKTLVENLFIMRSKLFIINN